ncbi:MAG: hypothetical protein JEZ12_15465 [Desulfobacterium sp.]|nr:hypothetical protein [Desulfobacterium sp.]
MNKAKICIIDETLREGMQHRGIVFSPDQAQTVLEFQATLVMDICQAGYPPAHVSEQTKLKQLVHLAQNRGFPTRVAAMGRACPEDAGILVQTGTMDFHLHAHVRQNDWNKDLSRIFETVAASLEEIRNNCPGACISLAILDIGRTDPGFLSRAATYLIKELSIDILSLPDTSGIMGPNQIYDTILPISRLAHGSDTRLSIHCHNDLGMASANTVMGVVAGATVVEASVLGLGERNGLADLYTTAKMLKDQGYALGINLEDVETFKAYYQYIDTICKDQTGQSLLTYNTPFFGAGVKTHVAGTHSGGGYGIRREQQFFINVLCGKKLVNQYLDQKGITYAPKAINAITQVIKNNSARLNRSLGKDEIQAIADACSKQQ